MWGCATNMFVACRRIVTTFYFTIFYTFGSTWMHIRLEFSSFCIFHVWCKVEALHLNLSNCTELQDLGTEKDIQLQCLVNLSFHTPNIHRRQEM